MAQNNFFNLLKPIEEPKSSWDKIYDWVLNRARVVILVVEIMMVVLFFAKVIVDNIEKNKLQEFEKIQLELKSQEAKYEQDFRQIQAKSYQYINLWNNSNSLFPVFNEVLGYIGDPSDPFSLTVSQSGVVNLDGYGSLGNLKKVEEEMKQSETFSSVGVNTLSLDSTDVIQQKGRYSLSGFIKEEMLDRERF